ncbi:DUF3231 family protein [Halobacillus naozhouensis]|uniref:DUF3231 family protein n=1 Tax=Halobacillus naozhouensis TaxID=554880 RepID=A0ABY8J4P1_9BACI|nr:DUF3231 family protein [Halobacillus naozhouensis]WFT76403.1 DUF3231 family protein [Halobacillus naozhouensis]
MEEGKNIRLTSAEITQIWTAYMNDTALVCHFKYFISKVEDKEILSLLRQSLDIAQGNVKALTAIFNKENYPLPYGFNLEEDVDVTAPRLYSDTYMLNFLHEGAQVVLQAYSIMLTTSVRSDIYSYFKERVVLITDHLREIKELLLAKGLYIRSPYLPTPENHDFVKDQSFLTGYFGERRPLAGTEILNLYTNFQRNALGVATMIGFSQVAKSKEVRKFLVRGKEIAAKHCEVFGSKMKEDDIPIPMTWETEVTDSITYTFSDKIMMFYSTALIGLSVGYYGTAMAMSPRRDLGVMYTRLIAEILKYAEDGAKIMIKHGWMEEPPRALDRDELAKKKSN